MLDADDAAVGRTRRGLRDHHERCEEQRADHADSLGGVSGSGDGDAAGSSGSTWGHKYAKYSPADTNRPSASASTNGPQITPG